jgi:hypothetical protein
MIFGLLRSLTTSNIKIEISRRGRERASSVSTRKEEKVFLKKPENPKTAGRRRYLRLSVSAKRSARIATPSFLRFMPHHSQLYESQIKSISSKKRSDGIGKWIVEK